MKDLHMPRGYCAIGIYGCKTEANIGGLWRSAHAFGAAYIFCIGPRYHRALRRQASDVSHATENVPFIVYDSFTAFLAARPKGAMLIGVEQTPESAQLETFCHPRCAIYLLGAEDGGLPPSIMEHCNKIIAINTPVCLNVATAGSIVLYDREQKQTQARLRSGAMSYHHETRLTCPRHPSPMVRQMTP